MRERPTLLLLHGGPGSDHSVFRPFAAALAGFAQVIYLVGSLFQGIAYQPFILTLLGVQCAVWTWCRLADSPRRKRLRKAPPPVAVTAEAAPLR